MREDLDPVGWLARVARRLDARPLEVVGLAVVLVGGVVLTAVQILGPWFAGRLSSPPAAVAASAAPGTGPTVVGSVAPSTVTVHVAGAVARPGIVTLPAGARVADAVRAADGPTPDADLTAVNLARVLDDGERVLVPTVGASAPPATATQMTGADAKIDLNRADEATLEQLPGVGPVLASRIIRFREEHGPFRDVGQLRDVAGIGERTFQSLVDLVTV